MSTLPSDPREQMRAEFQTSREEFLRENAEWRLTGYRKAQARAVILTACACCALFAVVVGVWCALNHFSNR